MKIVCYGDSNTWGYNPANAFRYERRWTELLQEACPEDTVIAEGLNGRTMAYDDPYDKDRNAKKDMQRLIKTHLPIDVLIIMLGTNDAKRIFNTTPISLEKGMRTLIYEALNPDLYRSGFKIPKILVVSPPKMHPDYDKNPETKVTFGKEGYEVLEQAGQVLSNVPSLFADYDVDFMDTSDICMAQACDGIHMDEENHEKLAKAIIERIQSYR